MRTGGGGGFGRGTAGRAAKALAVANAIVATHMMILMIRIVPIANPQPMPDGKPWNSA